MKNLQRTSATYRVVAVANFLFAIVGAEFLFSTAQAVRFPLKNLKVATLAIWSKRG
jgi:hypothetical protein